MNNFHDFFRNNKNTMQARKAFAVLKDRTLSYGDIDDLTARFYTYCTVNGLSQGDRAVIISHDDISVITLFMGCLRYGITAVILNADAPDNELNALICAAKPKALFMDASFFGPLSLPDQCVELKINPNESHKKPGIVSQFTGNNSETFPRVMYNHDPAVEFLTIQPDETAYILFTSGTTSQPKGVEITHGNLLAQMNTFIGQYGYTQDSRILDILPLHHTDGLTQGPVVAFCAGATALRPLRFEMNKIPALLDSMYKYKITHFVAVPAMLSLIENLEAQHDDAFQGNGFQFIISTAGYLDPNLWQRFEDRFDTMIVNVYGLTETVCESLYCGPSKETRKIGTVGKPVDSECRIVGDNGQNVKNGESGEIWLRGAHIMKGYFENPAATAEVLTTDGWFKTGDLGRIDEDGFYHIVGRKKNVVIVGGINVYPDDVANILRSLPGVTDASVWGEADETWGEIVVAAVTGKNIDTDLLSKEFLNHGTVQSLPRQIHVIDGDFPRGPAGKVILRDLQELIAKESSTQTEKESHNLETQILTIAAKSFKCPVEDLHMESTAETTKGWNSLAHVEFLLNLEKECGVKIEPKDIMSVRSIGDAMRVVQQKQKGM